MTVIFQKQLLQLGGGVLACGTEIYIESNTISNNKLPVQSSVSLESEPSTFSKGGGVFLIDDVGTSAERPFTFKNNKILSNFASSGGGILIQSLGNNTKDLGALFQITENVVENNVANKGGGVFLSGVTIYYMDLSGEDPSFELNDICLNKAEYGGGIFCYFSNTDLKHCNISYNEVSSLGAGLFSQKGTINGNPITKIYYSIIWGNKINGVIREQAEFQTPETVGVFITSDIISSCIQNTGSPTELPIVVYPLNNGTVNSAYLVNPLFDDPKFIDPYTYNWILSSDTPCLVTIGQQEIFYGAHKVDPEILQESKIVYNLHKGFNWISFPKLYNRDIEANTPVDLNSLLNGEDGIYSNGLDNLGIEIKDQNDLSSLYSLIDMSWYSGNNLTSINTTKGYKLELNTPPGNEYKFIVSGKTLNPKTVMEIQSDRENWIGYFLPESRLPEEAFGDIMNNLISIKTEKWAMMRTDINSPWNLSSKQNVLNYGDMAAIRFDRAQPNINVNFQWITGSTRERGEKELSQLFTFDQKSDYVPIYVNIENESKNIPKEIAIFADGVCKGASVYEGEITQINAYLDENDQNAEISFAFAYDSKSPIKKINNYTVIDVKSQEQSNIPILFQMSDTFYKVKISKQGNNVSTPLLSYVRNYPNPFNPETSFLFYISKEERVNISVYNIKGQKVSEVVDRVLPIGKQKISWNGKDKNGKAISSGLYFYKIKAGSETVVKKMTLIK